MKKVNRRRAIIWGGVGLVVVALFVVAMIPQPAAVDLAAATRGALRVTLDHEGLTRVRDRFVVSAPVSGRVLRIELEPGDPVTAGKTVLARFRPGAPALLDVRTRAEAESRVKAAAAAVETARAQRDQARVQSEHAATELARARRLEESGVISEQELRVFETDAKVRAQALKGAEAATEAAEFDLATARAALIEPETGRGTGATLALTSPIDGVVLRRFKESEAPVPAGEPLVEVADPAALEVIADYLSADAVRIQPGMPVVVDQWGGGRTLQGRVRRVEPSAFLKVSALGVEEQRVWVVMDFEDPHEAWEALGDGYRVETRVVIWEQPDVLQVPTSSLFRHGERWAVFVVEEGRARLREVKVGRQNGVNAEILAGLASGAQVILHPPDTVTDGVRIAPRS